MADDFDETYEPQPIKVELAETEHTINLNVSGEIEYDMSIGLVFAIIILCVSCGSVLSSYDKEIRCSMGNKIECAKVEINK